MSLSPRSRQGQFSTRPVQRRQTQVGLLSLLFSDRLCSKHKSMRSKTESLQYPSGLDLDVKSVWASWLFTLQNIWSNKIYHWFTAISGFCFFFLWCIICNWDNPPLPQNSSEILQAERLSTRWCTKGKQRWYQETEKSEFRPDARESHTTSQAWYAVGGMPLPGERGLGRRGQEGGGQFTAHTCCSVSL